MPAQIRKIVVQVEDTRIEMGRAIEPATRKALAMAVIHNPYAGRYAENLDELIAIGEELGGLLGRKCVAALGNDPGAAQSYGKAAIVGEAGELEHAAAILHPRAGARRCGWRWKRVRRWCHRPRSAAAWARPSTCRWATRTPLSCAAISTAMEARIGDAPRADEIVVAVVVTDSGRPLARVGGLQAHEIKGQDGLR